MEDTASNLLSFAIRRSCVALIKQSLQMLENLQSEHNEMLEKLYRGAKVEDANYFTQEKFKQCRKRILDGNDILRDLEEQLKNYEINFR